VQQGENQTAEDLTGFEPIVEWFPRKILPQHDLPQINRMSLAARASRDVSAASIFAEFVLAARSVLAVLRTSFCQTAVAAAFSITFNIASRPCCLRRLVEER
jgi:hypothetical protein